MMIAKFVAVVLIGYLLGSIPVWLPANSAAGQGRRHQIR